MDSYSVVVKRDAEKELRALPKADLARVAKRISGLGVSPRSHGVEKLSSNERYRTRQGDWRIVFEINDAERKVTIVKIGHRREVYR